nr:hypothetical protein [uncultured Niameybacter sp.]
MKIISKYELLNVYPVKDLTFIEPTLNSHANKGTVTGISNAWREGTIIDAKGWLWVNTDKLHTILRTNKDNARYQLSRIESEFKVNRGNKSYVRGFKILELIARTIEEDGIGRKGIYLETSKDYYDAINRCDKAARLRMEYDNALKEERKTLKRKRIKKYNLKEDELTGEKLNKSKSDFSHVRSVGIYKTLSDHIENGLIVNKKTHEIITTRGINDEVELKHLCEEMNWKVDWYKRYRQIF